MDADTIYYGSSDVPILLGLSPWKSQYDLWLRKMNMLEREPASSSPAIELGVMLEPFLLDWAEKQLGPISRGCEATCRDYRLRVHPDGLTQDGEPVEAKTSGIVSRGRHFDWGEEGSGEIPEVYRAQCAAHCLATGRDTCHVPALIAGIGLRMYRVVFARDVLQRLGDYILEWHEKHIVRGNPPADSRPSLEALQLLRRDSEKQSRVPSPIIDRFLAAQEGLRAAEKEFEEAKKNLIESLGDAEYGRDHYGREVTYYAVARRGYTVEPATYRRLVVRHRTDGAEGDRERVEVVPEA